MKLSRRDILSTCPTALACASAIAQTKDEPQYVDVKTAYGRLRGLLSAGLATLHRRNGSWTSKEGHQGLPTLPVPPTSLWNNPTISRFESMKKTYPSGASSSLTDLALMTWVEPFLKTTMKRFSAIRCQSTSGGSNVEQASSTCPALPDSNLVARKFAQTMIILVATPQYVMRYGMPASPEDLRRFPAVVFVERGSAQPWSIGSGQNAKRIIPTGVFRTSDIEQMRMGVLEHLGIAQAPAWLFAAELREGTVLRLLTPFERNVPIVAVRPASRRISAKVRILIEHLEKTFALCSQFNPRAPG